MWELTIEWYDIVIRATLVYFFFFALFRIIGKKHTGEYSKFDLILLLIISELVEATIIQEDQSMTALIIGATTLVSLSVIVDKISYRFPKFELLVNGDPVILIRDGKLCLKELKKEEISEAEMNEALHMNGLNDIKNIEYAILESNGKISIIQKE